MPGCDGALLPFETFYFRFHFFVVLLFEHDNSYSPHRLKRGTRSPPTVTKSANLESGLTQRE